MDTKKKWKKHTDEAPKQEPVKTKKYRPHSDIRKAMYGAGKKKDEANGKET